MSPPAIRRPVAARGIAPAPRRLRGPGALFLVGLCFAASGLLRALGTAPAIAEEIAATRALPPAEPPAAGCTPDPGIAALLAAIREREAGLAAQAAALDRRARLIEVARAKLEEQIAALTDAEARLAETLALADKAAEQDVARLVAVYEAMPPKAAAGLFATMDVAFAAGFLGRMRAEPAAAILALVPSDRAYAISAALAGRNARAPTE
jgi:flagellar motility protein MotE (MotC chaperone)